jgi:hypothetical protein
VNEHKISGCILRYIFFKNLNILNMFFNNGCIYTCEPKWISLPWCPGLATPKRDASISAGYVHTKQNVCAPVMLPRFVCTSHIRIYKPGKWTTMPLSRTYTHVIQSKPLGDHREFGRVPRHVHAQHHRCHPCVFVFLFSWWNSSMSVCNLDLP